MKVFIAVQTDRSEVLAVSTSEEKCLELAVNGVVKNTPWLENETITEYYHDFDELIIKTENEPKGYGFCVSIKEHEVAE